MHKGQFATLRNVIEQLQFWWLKITLKKQMIQPLKIWTDKEKEACFFLKNMTDYGL